MALFLSDNIVRMCITWYRKGHYIGQVRFVYPVLWHLPHLRGRFGVGGAIARSKETRSLCEVLAVAGFGREGLGQVRSAASLELQCWQMFSYRYHCLLMSSPGISVWLGKGEERSVRSAADLDTSISTSSLSEYSQTKIIPGLSDLTRKL